MRAVHRNFKGDLYRVEFNDDGTLAAAFRSRAGCTTKVSAYEAWRVMADGKPDELMEAFVEGKSAREVALRASTPALPDRPEGPSRWAIILSQIGSGAVIAGFFVAVLLNSQLWIGIFGGAWMVALVASWIFDFKERARETDRRRRQKEREAAERAAKDLPKLESLRVLLGELGNDRMSYEEFDEMLRNVGRQITEQRQALNACPQEPAGHPKQ